MLCWTCAGYGYIYWGWKKYVNTIHRHRRNPRSWKAAAIQIQPELIFMSILPSLNRGSTSSSSSELSPSSTSNHGLLSPPQSHQHLQFSDSPPPPNHLPGFPSSFAYIHLFFYFGRRVASPSAALVFCCFHLFGDRLICSNFWIGLTLASLFAPNIWSWGLFGKKDLFFPEVSPWE